MPGEIKIEITGDTSKYDRALAEVDRKANKTQTLTLETLQDILNYDRITSKTVTRTVQAAAVDLNTTQKQGDNVLFEINIKMKRLRDELGRFRAATDQEIEEVRNILTQTEKQAVEVDRKAKLTVSNTLFALRSVTDILALYSVITGEHVDVAAFALISMSLSAMMQVKAQAAVFMATPGLQAFGLMMLAMLPMFTGLISYVQSEQSKLTQQLSESRTAELDNLLDGVNYNG